MNQVYCFDEQGNTVMVAADLLRPVPAAYGVLIEHGQVLLVQRPQTTLWQPPGGLLAQDELPESLLRQQVRQVLGVVPEVGDLLHVEAQNRVDAQGQPWRVAALYYALSRPEQPSAIRVDTADTAVEWIALADLRRDMLNFGYEAIWAGEVHGR